MLWLNLNKINEISFFYNQHINKVTPHFTSCAGFKTQIPIHTNSIGCPKIFPLSAPVLVIASDMHLEPESENRAKNVDFYTAKNIQIQTIPFRYF